MSSAQLNLFDEFDSEVNIFDHATDINLDNYSKILIMFSGGKDSLACLLNLIERGVDLAKVELWHHDVDGREDRALMDWPITRAYCQAIAEHFNVSLHFSWKEGGFRREMLRDNTPTAAAFFETPDGICKAGGGSKQLGTRFKFPQTSADLRVRWCSAYLKIDVASKAITNQTRFCNTKTLVVTGERAQESSARAKYATFEPHKTDCRSSKRLGRHIDHYRPVHGWDEQQVWDIIQRHSIAVHPAYYLGWGRVSCMTCIFGSKDQWASIRVIAPARFTEIADYENQFGCTIQRNHDVNTLANQGVPYAALKNEVNMVTLALSETYSLPIKMDDWRLPEGAFGECSGPL